MFKMIASIVLAVCSLTAHSATDPVVTPKLVTQPSELTLRCTKPLYAYMDTIKEAMRVYDANDEVRFKNVYALIGIMNEKQWEIATLKEMDAYARTRQAMDDLSLQVRAALTSLRATEEDRLKNEAAILHGEALLVPLQYSTQLIFFAEKTIACMQNKNLPS